jgi:hypothetical protein
MQGEGIAWRNVPQQRRIPGDELRCANEIKVRGHQRRHMQRLADVAGRIRPIRIPMLVEEGTARRKVEQRSTSQHRQCAVHGRSSENGSPRRHQATP